MTIVEKHLKKGSFTVEAALIIPLITGIIIILIHAVLVMHDRGYVYMKLSEYAETGDDFTNDIYNECEKHLFISNVSDITFESTYSENVISAVICTKSSIFKDRHITVKRYVPDYCKYIRSQELFAE